jgi:hypothetical protein
VVELVSTVQNHIYFPFESTYTTVDTAYEREANNLVLTYERLDDTQPDTTLSLPLVRDKVWRISDYAVARVLQQEDVTVPAGTFRNAWKIQETFTEGSQTVQEYVWFANNTGPVKTYWQSAYGTASYTFTLELTSVTIR